MHNVMNHMREYRGIGDAQLSTVGAYDADGRVNGSINSSRFSGER